MRFLVLHSFCLISSLGLAADGQFISVQQTQADPSESYALYLPPRTVADQAAALLVLLDPAGDAGGFVRGAREAAREAGFVVASPYGSRNYQPFDQTYKAVAATINDVVSRYRIDQSQIYLGGFSGGARLATEIAAMFPSAGVILGGAGFGRPVEKAPRFPVVTLVGDRDMNYQEIQRLTKTLAKKKAPHLAVEYRAGHRMFGTQEWRIALTWLRLQKDAANPKLQSLWLQLATSKLKDYEAGGQMDLAVGWANLGLALTGKDLEGREALSDAVIRLEPEVKKILKARKAADAWEVRTRARLWQRAGSLKQRVGPMKTEQAKELRVWQKEVQKLTDALSDDLPPYRLNAVHRLIGGLWAMCYEQPIVLMQAGDWPTALLVSRIGLLFDRNPGVFQFNVACALANMGRTEEAFKTLETCADNGFALPKGLARLELLQPLKDDARFEPLMDRILRR